MNAPPAASGKDRRETDQEWEQAQERVLLYLRLLRVPGLEALEVAHQALSRAAREAEASHPAAAAMKAVRELLEEKNAASDLPLGPGNRFGKICPWPELSERVGVPRDTLSMPLLNRGFMIPDRL